MADLDTLRDSLHISVSAIRAYMRCGRAFELRYVLGAKPAFKPVPLAFGTSFHAALGRFYLAVREKGVPPPLQLVTETFRDAWQRGGGGRRPSPGRRGRARGPGAGPGQGRRDARHVP